MQATRGAPVEAAAGTATRRRTTTLLLTALVILVADVVSKVAVVATLHPGERVHVLGDLLVIVETRNSGAAFSIGTGATILFSAVALAVVVVILRAARRLRSRAWALTLGLLLGGAIGNLIDRLVRSPGPLRGHVVDWIELPHWPVFNVADSAIVVGGVIAVVLASRGTTLDGSDPAPPAGDSAGRP